MARIIAVLTAGILIGVLGMFAGARIGLPIDQPTDTIVRNIANVPKMAQEVADEHRQEHYEELDSVAQVLALPTEFSRAEAIYVLAGRSDTAGIQDLIFEANGIRDDVQRVEILKILFTRLAEADPQSALALSRIDDIKGVRSIEAVVWRTWARKDLDDALFAAKTQTSATHKRFAAQSLYAAFGYLGNDTTDRIESELGIPPDRNTRGRYLYQLADRSPAEAIAFINGIGNSYEQQEYADWLAYYLALRDPANAVTYASLFDSAPLAERFSRIINSDVARENPHAVIERLLASGPAASSRGELHSAIRALAGSDPDAIRQYFEAARSAEERQIIGSAFVAELAKKDPAEALKWAQENDSGQFPYLLMTALGQIAESDPQLALTEAQNFSNSELRSNLISNVIQRVVRDDPLLAVAFLEQIEDPRQKSEASRQLASSWIRSDPEKAMDWILSLDERTAARVVQQASNMLVRSDIDSAIRLLPRLDEQSQIGMRQQIAQTLATSRSATEAQAFIRQFEGQPGYGQLQASLISGVAQTDVLTAKQLADQLSDGETRNSAYVQVIAQRAQTHPAEAISWLGNVTEERQRGIAAGQLAAQWYTQDPAAAVRWVADLPAGTSKDDAIMNMSYRWRETTPELERLISSIEDRDKRGQAKIRRIYSIMQTDPARARELLDDEDIPSYIRQQAETAMSQRYNRF